LICAVLTLVLAPIEEKYGTAERFMGRRHRPVFRV
jgi:hypothetical protein